MLEDCSLKTNHNQSVFAYIYTTYATTIMCSINQKISVPAKQTRLSKHPIKYFGS